MVKASSGIGSKLSFSIRTQSVRDLSIHGVLGAVVIRVNVADLVKPDKLLQNSQGC